MYKTLRRESLKAVLPRLLVCAILAVGLLAVSGGGLVKTVLGPKPLSNPAQGQYVTFDASEVIVAFANLSVNRSDGTSETKKTYYLLPVGDGTYMAVMDSKERNANLIERAMEQSHEYYLGDLETLTPLGSVSGTVTALEDGMLDYMADCIDNYQLPGYQEGADSMALLVPYQINLGYVGFLTRPLALGFGITGLVFLLLAIVQLLTVQLGCYQKKVRDVVDEEDADAAFAAAKKIERIRVGKYIWYAKGPSTRVQKTADLIWGYALPEPMVVSKYRWPVAVYDREQHMTRIQFAEQKHGKAFLDAIAAQGHPFVQGYTSEISQKFQNNMEDFMQEAARQAEARQL